MKRIVRLLGLLLFALPAQAQYVQGGSVNAAADTIGGDWTAKASYSLTFAKPTTAPCTILIALRQPGLTVSDSQKNSFVLASNNLGRYDQLWYSTACGSGAETVTVSCPAAACWAQFTVSEYAGVWVADQFSDDTNATGLSSYTAPITPTQSGELIIGFGSNHATNTPQLTAGTGFTLRANANEFIEDLVQATAAPIFSSVTYPTSLTWCQSTVSFKPGGPPPLFVLKLPGLTNLTFLLSDPAQLPACKLSEGTCSLIIAVCFTDSGQCANGVKGSVSVVKVTNSSATSTAVIQASP